MARQELSRLVSQQLDQFLTKEEQKVEFFVKQLIEDVYLDITDFELSPKITGYYMTNHRIQLRGAGGQFAKGGGVKLFPTVKDSDEPGVYFDNLAQTVFEELAKLNDFKLGQVVTITTAVPYAAEVERKHNVYGTAQARVGAQAKRLES